MGYGLLESGLSKKNRPQIDVGIHKIGFYEREADKIAIRMKKNIFASQLPLDRKMHLRDLVETIEQLADEAENVGDRLSIYTIKRTF